MDKKFLSLVLFILIFSFWIFWLPGVRVANDYHLPQYIPTIERILPWSWRETNVADGLGEYTGITLWAQPLHSFFGILSALSIPPFLQTKLLGCLVFIMGFFSLSKLLQFIGIKGIGKYIGILFYLTNTYFLLLFDGGQISLALAYAISPFVLYLFLKMMEDFKFKHKLHFVVSILLISILDIRFIYLSAPILFLCFVFQLFLGPENKRLKLIKELLLTGVLLTAVIVCFHLYWILPSVLVKPPQLPQTYERVSQVNFLSFSSVGHSLLLQQPHWYKNIFGQVSSLRFEFILIPILVFLVPILRKNDKIVGFWLLIVSLGIFLSKGSQGPFGQAYTWLFTNVPGFSLFRDPTKFYLYISLAYSILIAISIKEILSRKGKFTNFARIIPYLILIYFVWLIRPVYLGQMTGLLSQPTFEREYSKLNEYLSKDSNYSRIFWIPTKAPLGIASNMHPPTEAAKFSQKRPFVSGIRGTYETFNFLREAPYMGQIFDIAGIGYIAYPPLDPRRDDMHQDNIRYYYTFSDQLAERGWLRKIDNSPINLFKVLEHQDRFFITSNIWWIIGPDNIYNESTKSARLKLSGNSLIFAEEYPGLGSKLIELPDSKIVLNNKSLVDLAASFINVANLIFPAKDLDFQADKSGWWKREAADLLSWRDFLQTKYGIDNQDFDFGGGWAIGEGIRKYQISNIKYQIGDSLLVRVMESSRGGSLRIFDMKNQLIGEIKTKVDADANIRWFEVGELKNGGENLSLESSGDINVVNALAILNRNMWDNFKHKAESLKGRVVSFDEKNTLDGKAKVTYKKINPTKYIVNVSGLTEPSFLVFSQNYDSLWKMNGQSPLPVYSLLNGFSVEKDGEYVVEYEAQKYVYPGLIISGITIVVLISLLIKYSKSS